MRFTFLRALMLSVAIGIAVTAVSGMPRFLWASPGGSAYGGGFPLVYSTEYFGGYAPCYRAPLSDVAFIEDAAFYSLIALAALFIARRVNR